jgi:hypothetical protein
MLLATASVVFCGPHVIHNRAGIRDGAFFLTTNSSRSGREAA